MHTAAFADPAAASRSAAARLAEDFRRAMSFKDMKALARHDWDATN
jgi:hypothetical protein